MYAVVRIGTHQYIAKPGEKIKVQKIDAPIGSEVRFQDLLMVSSDNSVKLKNVSGTVVGKIVEQDREKKVEVYKKKKRKGYEKTIGHRQYYTMVEIKGIEA
ncbi:MAG: 50S ribosomal protein L21 [Bdellovibrionota bacterium]